MSDEESPAPLPAQGRQYVYQAIRVLLDEGMP